MPHLLLQLEDTVHERLGGRRAARHVNIYRYNPVASPCDRVAVVVVASSVCAAAHGDDPSGVGHLVIDLSQGRCHLVCKGSSYNHDVGLAGRGTENDTETILVVPWGGQVHHLYGAAGETEGHGPERALAGPVGYLVECCPSHVSSCPLLSFSPPVSPPRAARIDIQCILHSTLLSFLARQWHLYSRLLHRWWRSRVARNGRR